MGPTNAPIEITRSQRCIDWQKKNSAKNAPQKRIKHPIEVQTEHGQLLLICTLIEKTAYKTPQQNLYVQFHAPNLKGSASPPIPRIQNKDKDPLPIRLQSPHTTASISQDAVYSVLVNAFLADVPHTGPTSLQ